MQAMKMNLRAAIVPVRGRAKIRRRYGGADAPERNARESLRARGRRECTELRNEYYEKEVGSEEYSPAVHGRVFLRRHPCVLSHYCDPSQVK